MKNFRALSLALVMMVSGNVFAAGGTSAGGVSAGDVPQKPPEPAQCPCGKNEDGSIKWCPCGSSKAESTTSSFSTTEIVLGVAVAGAVAAVASGGGSSTPSHLP
jgi:hypothetical protein